MIRPASNSTLAAVLVIAASCVSGRAPSGGAAVFSAVPLSDTELQIVYSAGEQPPYLSAFAALCRCAELAVDRGFRYLRIHDRKRLGPGEARWTLQLVHVPPEGAVVFDVAEPTWEGDSPADGLLDAGSYAAACHRRLPSLELTQRQNDMPR